MPTSYTRPSVYPDFCTNTANRSAPSVGEVAAGYQPDQIPPCEEHNYLFGTTGDWIRWLDQQQQLAAVQLEFDATIGTGGTYADINAMMTAIAAGTVINKALVITPQTLTSTEVIPSTVTDLEIVFKPGAFINKGGSVTPGLQIAGQRIRITGGRFTNFNGGSDVCIQLTSTAKNCRINGVNFFNSTTSIADGGNGNVLSNNIEEV